MRTAIRIIAREILISSLLPPPPRISLFGVARPPVVPYFRRVGLSLAFELLLGLGGGEIPIEALAGNLPKRRASQQV